MSVEVFAGDEPNTTLSTHVVLGSQKFVLRFLLLLPHWVEDIDLGQLVLRDRDSPAQPLLHHLDLERDVLVEHPR